jgi:hypothetical protein
MLKNDRHYCITVESNIYLRSFYVLISKCLLVTIPVLQILYLGLVYVAKSSKDIWLESMTKADFSSGLSRSTVIFSYASLITIIAGFGMRSPKHYSRFIILITLINSVLIINFENPAIVRDYLGITILENISDLREQTYFNILVCALFSTVIPACRYEKYHFGVILMGYIYFSAMVPKIFSLAAKFDHGTEDVVRIMSQCIFGAILLVYLVRCLVKVWRTRNWTRKNGQTADLRATGQVLNSWFCMIAIWGLMHVWKGGWDDRKFSSKEKANYMANWIFVVLVFLVNSTVLQLVFRNNFGFQEFGNNA